MEDFQPQIFFITQSVCSSLNDANLVVQGLDESERHFIFRFVISGDFIPMSINGLSITTMSDHIALWVTDHLRLKVKFLISSIIN